MTSLTLPLPLTEARIDPSAPVPLAGLDVERVRLPAERELFAALEAEPAFRALREAFEPPEPGVIRRILMGKSLRLTEGMAPEAYATARVALATLGIARPLEIYQSSGRENAAIHLIEEPILVEVQGRLLSLLDQGASLAVFGHELGHYLAHGPKSPLGRGSAIAGALATADGVPAPLQRLASTFSMVAELTADRFGLLACQDLEAALRLEMVSTTGLPAECLTWDTQAYLAQCRELMEQSPGGILGSTHPEHNLRAWAAWLFFESDLYRALTGRGPGARPIAEVNAALARVLERPDVDPTYHIYDEQPRELHECALACCVMVALADGELADVEAEAIERVFAPLVPDWRWYMNGDNARERFSEVGGLVAAGGRDVQRALFNLLLHVVGADGSMSEAELEMVVAIGDALGCGTLFRALLVPVMRQLGVSARDLSTVSVSVPLPARRDEAEAALGAFLDGFLRRGGGETSLRRLLRFLGAGQRTPELVTAVKRGLERAQLEADRELEHVALDERVGLSPREGARAPSRAQTRVQAVDTSPVRGRLQRALSKLRDELISGDGRSRSVRLYAPRSGRAFDLFSLEAVSVGLAERVLAQVRSGQRARVLDAAEVGKHDGARRVAAELVELDRENQARMDETGANDLFLGAPFLTGVVGGYLFRGPVVLSPVEIERDAAGARSFSLRPRKDKEPVANQALIRLLFHKLQFALPDELASKLDALAAEEGSEAVLEELERVGVELTRAASASTTPGFSDAANAGTVADTVGGGGAGSAPLVVAAAPSDATTAGLIPLRERAQELAEWSAGKRTRLEVEECAVLGLFPQSSSDLLQDYEGLFADLSQADLDPGEVLGCALELLPAEVRAAFAADAAPSTPPSPLVPVVYADPSQREVVTRARLARALVVDGPPGTGKSQVIVNLVADAIGRGQRVAVVSEKRAALDVVVQRLEGVGFRHLLALVHDVFEDRRSLYRQLAARLEDGTARVADEGRLAELLAEIERSTRALEARAAALAHRPPGLSLTTGQLHALFAGIDAPVVSGCEDLAQVDEAKLRGLSARLVALRPHADLFAVGAPWVAPPGEARRASLARLSEQEVAAVAAELGRAVRTAATYEQVLAASPAPLQDVLQARPALLAARELRPLRASLDDQLLFGRLLEAGAERRLELAAEAESAWRAHRDALERVRERVAFEADPAVERAAALILAWAGRFLRFFMFAWWGARSVLRKALLTAWPERSAEPLTAALALEVQARIRATRAWRAVDQAFATLGLPSLPAQADRAGAQVEKVGELARRVLPLSAARPQLTAAAAWPEGAAGPAWEAAIDHRLELLEARDAHLAASAPIVKLFPWLGELPSGAALRALEAAWASDAPRVVQADLELEAASAHYPGAPGLLERLATEHAGASASEWRSAVHRTWCAAWVAALEKRLPELRAFDAGDGPGLEQALARAVEEASSLERSRVIARLDDHGVLRAAQPLKGKRRTTDQAAREGMLKESKKQRNVLPLRSFVRKFAGQGLLELLPVWLMSPETMAVLFPREPLFDLVIFDEASQCTVQNGLPVLLRARRAVIAGDEKQMPPTSFFAAQVGQEDAASAAEGAADLLDEESLLTLARNRVEHAGLEWHYRCREEELIAFSNHAMYGGNLLTIPSTATRASAAAIRWIDVPDGEYEDGKNPREAKRVVEEVHELLRREPRPSVGVVTFNIQQRKAVLDEIDRRRGADLDFAARWDEAASSERLDERPFVKNLENVQGDERDVILFSLGHAPVEREVKGKGRQRYVPSRFGPLGQKGGERRLNVAVSRAKAECVIVSSFDPQLLSVARTTHDGPKLFKAFLEFAQHLAGSRRAQADRVLALLREAGEAERARTSTSFPGFIPLKAQIAAALEERGLAYELDVGSSRFRVPLAVIDPAAPSRYALAVLCDEGDDDASVFDRHVQRPQALEARGWKVLRVTARDWMRAPARELERIAKAMGRG